MPQVVRVSSVEKTEKLKTYLMELFKEGRYAEITEAIGMHSLIVDPQHTLSDQAGLYRFVLDLVRERIHKARGKGYAAWYEGFPKVMDRMIDAGGVVADRAAADMLASHRAAYGRFKSVEDFFFWALDDRRLPLEQIVECIEKTAELKTGKV